MLFLKKRDNEVAAWFSVQRTSGWCELDRPGRRNTARGRRTPLRSSQEALCANVGGTTAKTEFSRPWIF